MGMASGAVSCLLRMCTLEIKWDHVNQRDNVEIHAQTYGNFIQVRLKIWASGHPKYSIQLCGITLHFIVKKGVQAFIPYKVDHELTPLPSFRRVSVGHLSPSCQLLQFLLLKCIPDFLHILPFVSCSLNSVANCPFCFSLSRQLLTQSSYFATIVL